MNLIRIVILSIVFGTLVTYHVLPKQREEMEEVILPAQEIVDAEDVIVSRFEEAVKDTFYSDNN